MKRWLPWISGAVILAGMVWSFVYLKDIYPIGSHGSKLGRDSLEGISIRFKNATLVGRSEGKKVWTFKARIIDVSKDRRLAIFRDVAKGILLQDGKEIASLSSKKVAYNTITNNVSAPLGAEFVLKGGPTFKVHDVFWSAQKSKLLCQKGIDMELAGSTLHGENMTADLNKKELVIGKVNGKIKLDEGM